MDLVDNISITEWSRFQVSCRIQKVSPKLLDVPPVNSTSNDIPNSDKLAAISKYISILFDFCGLVG